MNMNNIFQTDPYDVFIHILDDYFTDNWAKHCSNAKEVNLKYE